MEIEYSNEVKGRVYAYRFNDWEREILCKGLPNEINKIEKKIERIKNNPKNEGQVRYQVKIERLIRDRNDILEILKNLK